MPKSKLGRQKARLLELQAKVNAAAATPATALNLNFRYASRRIKQLKAMVDYLIETNPSIADDPSLAEAAFRGDIDKIIAAVDALAVEIQDAENSSNSSSSSESSGSTGSTGSSNSSSSSSRSTASSNSSSSSSSS